MGNMMMMMSRRRRRNQAPLGSTAIGSESQPNSRQVTLAKHRSHPEHMAIMEFIMATQVVTA
jgi:hypothetical protein